MFNSSPYFFINMFDLVVKHLDSIKEGRETRTHTLWRKKTIPKRFSGIICNKALLSCICLRVMPVNFSQMFN